MAHVEITLNTSWYDASQSFGYVWTPDPADRPSLAALASAARFFENLTLRRDRLGFVLNIASDTTSAFTQSPAVNLSNAFANNGSIGIYATFAGTEHLFRLNIGDLPIIDLDSTEPYRYDFTSGSDLGNAYTTFRGRFSLSAPNARLILWDGQGTDPFSGAPAAPTKLTTPTGLSRTAGNAQVALSWTDVANESNYALQYRTGTSGAWTDWGTDPAADATSATITGLTNGQLYQFRIRAEGDGTNYSESDWSTPVAGTPVAPSTPTATQLAAPASLSATAGDGQVVLSWDVVANASNYQAQYRAGTSGAWTDDSQRPTGTNAVITGLTNGTAYQFRVRANGDGTTYSNSAWTTPVTATPVASQAPPSDTTAPSPVAASVNSDGTQITITFDENLDASHVPPLAAFTITVS